MEMWWDSSHNWNVEMKGYTVFRRDRPGRKSGEIARNVQHLHCFKLCLGVDDEQVESLQIRMKHQTSNSDIVVAVCYRSSEQENEADKD